jgi:transposase
MTIETLGVDIAKNVFQLHGVNRNGRVVLKRCAISLSRR